MEGVIKAFEITFRLLGTLRLFEVDLILKTFVLLLIAAEQLTFRLTPDIMAGDEEHDGERDNVAMGLKLR